MQIRTSTAICNKKNDIQTNPIEEDSRSDPDDVLSVFDGSSDIDNDVTKRESQININTDSNMSPPKKPQNFKINNNAESDSDSDVVID